jgi:hypothetical protein
MKSLLLVALLLLATGCTGSKSDSSGGGPQRVDPSKGPSKGPTAPPGAPPGAPLDAAL